MTDREKTAHVLRRFGMGAGTIEMAKYESLGSQGTLDRLLNYEKVDEGFNVSPWEMAFEKDKTDVYVDPYRFAAWWSLRILMTERPLEQRLAVFWHNHLVVGAEKLEFGPSMVEYLEAIRAYGIGEFGTLLAAVCQTPAMIKYLDSDLNAFGAPNENFGREVMELFTLGIGNYTEDDVKNAARAFSGWSLRYPLYEAGNEAVQPRLRDGLLKGYPMIAAAFSPGMHDNGPKTIVGETKNFGFYDGLAMLAGRAETAKHIGKKLFENFAYRDPAQPVVDHVAQLFTSSNGNIRATLKGISQMEEFWSDACVRKQVKSPVDFCIPIARQTNIRVYLNSLRPTPQAPPTPLNDGLRGVAGLLLGMLSDQGQFLFYPPNVKGWDGGTAWITANTMSSRIRLGNSLFGVGNPDKGLVTSIGAQVKGLKPTSDVEALEAFLQVFDADVYALEKKKLLLKAFTKGGGLAALDKPEGCSDALSAVARLVFGSPEFQFC